MKINIFGIPSLAGALYEGTEQAPRAIRNAQLIERLRGNGFSVEDNGDLVDCTFLPRHNIGPIRNWPAPRIVWEVIDENASLLFKPDSFSIILGGDCSIEVGTFTAFRKIFGENSHLLVLDGHVDTMKPSGDRCIGAAGMGLWFLTQNKKGWWKQDPIPPNAISVIGAHTISENQYGINVVPLQDVRIENVFSGVRENANILVHFDVDVLNETVMPSAYSPSKEGLNFGQASSLLTTILKDPRVKGIEVTEFSANKDEDGSSAKVIVDLLCLMAKRD
jgi:arginase